MTVPGAICFSILDSIITAPSSTNVSLASLFCMMYIVQQTVIKLMVQWKERELGNPLGLRW